MKMKKISISVIACISIGILTTQAFATEVINDDLNVTGNVSVGVTSNKDTYIEVGNSSDRSDHTGVVKINGWGEAIVFNDTYDTDDLPYEWSIQAENYNFSAYWSIYNEYAEDNIILLAIGEDTAANAVNSLVVDNEGDIFLANGTVSIDKSSSRMGIGTAVPRDNLHIVEDDNTVNAGHAGIRLEGKTDVVNWNMGAHYYSPIVLGERVIKEFHIRDNINNTTPFTIENNATTNSLYVQDGGNVGIGTGWPFAKLDVRGDAIINGELVTTKAITTSFSGSYDKNLNKLFTISQNNTDTNYASDAGFIIENKRDTFRWTFRTYNEDSNTPESFSISKVASGGKEMVLTGLDAPDGLEMLMGDGGKYSNGQWMDASSRAYKENIKALDSKTAMEAFSKLTPVTYNYKTNKDEAIVGFIAEDVPDMLAPNDHKSLSGLEMVALLTKVVQTKEKEMIEMKERQKVQEEKIAKLESLLTNLALNITYDEKEKITFYKK